jgi:hypothetical protein
VPLAAVQQQDVTTELEQLACGHQAGDARPDHNHVCPFHRRVDIES